MNRPDEWADYLDPSVPRPTAPDQEFGADEQSARDRSALDRIAVILSDEGVWSEPPAQLRADLLARVAAEAGPRSLRPAPSLPPERLRPPAPSPRSARAQRDRRPWYLAVAAAAAAAAVVVVLAWPRPPVTTFAMAGTALSGTASATAELEERSAGVAITLNVKGLKPAPAGAYYAAWMRGPAGTVPVGTFHWRKGGIPIDLWSGVTPNRYPELFVTLQREGQPATPSAEVVLQGRVGD